MQSLGKDTPSLHQIAANNDVEKLTSKLLHFCQSQETKDIAEIINKKNDEAETPLHVAAKFNRNQSHFEVAKMLLRNGADPNVKDLKDRTPLRYLIPNCNLEILKLFQSFKADLTQVNKKGWSLLGAAVATKNTDNMDVIKFLVEDIGLDVNHRDTFGMTPLHLAAVFNKIDSHYEILEYLLEKGADVNARSTRLGITPLYFLVESGNWMVIELFLKHNADVHAVTDAGRSILFAFNRGDCDLQVLDKLINNFGLDVNHTDSDKCTTLHYIVGNRFEKLINIKVIKCLLRNGGSINTPDIYGLTSLFLTVNYIGEVIGKERFMESSHYFSFIIDQVDFNIVHENKHVLGYYDDEGVEKNHQSHPEYIWKWILEHLAKLNFLNIPIHPMVLEFIENHTEHKNYFKKSIEELQLMKKTKLQDSWVTIFNLLVDSRRKLKNYAGNRNLVKDFQKRNCLIKFPVYGAQVMKNVEKGIKSRELFHKSATLLSDFLPIFDTEDIHLIVRDILDCILSKKDLSNFCE